MHTQKFIHKSSGIALLIVLLCIQVFALLSITSLITIQMQLKLHHETWTRTTNLIFAKQLLHKIESELNIAEPNCMISLTTAKSIKNMSIEAWQRQACIADNSNDLYVIESLGSNDCSIIIDKRTEEHMVAKFYRISLLVSQKFNQRLILQSIVSVPMLISSTCQSNPHLVTLGQQMWREI